MYLTMVVKKGPCNSSLVLIHKVLALVSMWVFSSVALASKDFFTLFCLETQVLPPCQPTQVPEPSFKELLAD